jgi:hypothetical protein
MLASGEPPGKPNPSPGEPELLWPKNRYEEAARVTSLALRAIRRRTAPWFDGFRRGAVMAAVVVLADYSWLVLWLGGHPVLGMTGAGVSLVLAGGLNVIFGKRISAFVVDRVLARTEE